VTGSSKRKQSKNESAIAGVLVQDLALKADKDS
jgi:hypothetical protein